MIIARVINTHSPLIKIQLGELIGVVFLCIVRSKLEKEEKTVVII